MIVDVIRGEELPEFMCIKMVGPSEVHIKITTDVPTPDGYVMEEIWKPKCVEEAKRLTIEKYGKPFKELEKELEPWDFFDKTKKRLIQEKRHELKPLLDAYSQAQKEQRKKDIKTVDEIYDHVLYYWTQNQTNQKFLNITPDGEKK